MHIHEQLQIMPSDSSMFIFLFDLCISNPQLPSIISHYEHVTYTYLNTGISLLAYLTIEFVHGCKFPCFFLTQYIYILPSFFVLTRRKMVMLIFKSVCLQASDNFPSDQCGGFTHIFYVSFEVSFFVYSLVTLPYQGSGHLYM